MPFKQKMIYAKDRLYFYVLPLQLKNNKLRDKLCIIYTLSLYYLWQGVLFPNTRSVQQRIHCACSIIDLRTDSASGAPICRSYILLCHDYLEDFLFSMVGVMGQQLVIILDNIIVWVHFGEKISQVN